MCDVREYDILQKKTLRFVVEFGSHVSAAFGDVAYVPGRSPRDIDVFFHGMSSAEARDIVRRRYPRWRGPIDLNKVSFYGYYDGSKTYVEPCVKIPTPYDADSPWRILHFDPIPPAVKNESVTGSLPSIFRASSDWEVALERIRSVGTMTICLEDDDETDEAKWPNFEDRLYGENNDRTAIAKAAFDHFGAENFAETCRRLWWGPFLERFVREKPSEKGLAECRKWSPMGGRIGAKIDSENEAFFQAYGPMTKDKNSGEFVYYCWNLEEFMTLLYS